MCDLTLYSPSIPGAIAPGLLRCLQSPAQCSAVLWKVINPVWPKLSGVMASCGISIYPYPTLTGWKPFRMTYFYLFIIFNKKLRKTAVAQSKQKLDLRIFIHISWFDRFQLLSRKVLKLSKRIPMHWHETTNRTEEEVSLNVTCA